MQRRCMGGMGVAMMVLGVSAPAARAELERILNEDHVFAALTESFVPLHLDITQLSARDEQLQAKYRAPTLPAVIFVDASGWELGRWATQDSADDAFLAQLRQVVSTHPLPGR
ncbi:MAG: hypothetical protein VYE73_03200 [Acidobacteriota bacterium]|nr:hypothetical protein [Acidobacteriota bacterium]